MLLVGADRDKILNAIKCFNPENNVNNIYGHFAAKQITSIIKKSRL